MRGNRGTDSSGEIGSAAIRDDDGGSSKSSLTNVQLSLLVATLVVIADQLTKWWAETTLPNNSIVIIPDFFQFRLTYNTGAAFSMFSQGGPVLAVIAIAVVAVIMFVLSDASRRIEAVALGMVLGGSIGNLIDRIARGKGFLDGGVVDFIDFSFFATFNVADMGITLGVGLLLIAALLPKR